MSEFEDAIQESGLSGADKGRLIRMIRLQKYDACDLAPEELREVRQSAGLSVGQASKLLGLNNAAFLEAAECDPNERFTDEVYSRMNEIYDIGWKGGAK